MECLYFASDRCRSCTQIEVPYPEQVEAKQRHAQQLLAEYSQLRFLPAQVSDEAGFRNKAKMVISGTTEQPSIGILDADGHGIDLRNCGICDPQLRRAFTVVERFIKSLGIIPYDVTRRKGELKHVIVTANENGELMLRWVLRSMKHFVALRDSLEDFQRELRSAKVISVNLLREHKAVLEGPEEIMLTRADTLTMNLNGIPMHLRPQGFFQTNSQIAAALYRQARQWVNDVNPAGLWDLYSGVGGFALHCASDGRQVTGIETSAEAVAAASKSAAELGQSDTRFITGDAAEFVRKAQTPPELVIVNPPRRGIGADLAQWLNDSSVQHVIYSSCNAVSLAKDLKQMPALRPVTARVMDMFPQTKHYEVIVKLERVAV